MRQSAPLRRGGRVTVPAQNTLPAPSSPRAENWSAAPPGPATDRFQATLPADVSLTTVALSP